MRTYVKNRFYFRGWTTLGVANTLLAWLFNRVVVLHVVTDDDCGTRVPHPPKRIVGWHWGKGTDFRPAERK